MMSQETVHPIHRRPVPFPEQLNVNVDALCSNVAYVVMGW